MTSALATVNIAARFDDAAARVPAQAALVTPAGTLTYAELAARIDRTAHALARLGLERGMRAVMLVPAGQDFFTLVYALFKLGVVPVFIDPMMGFKGMGRVIAEAAPDAFIGVPK